MAGCGLGWAPIVLNHAEAIGVGIPFVVFLFCGALSGIGEDEVKTMCVECLWTLLIQRSCTG